VWDVVVTKPAGYGNPWYAYINTTPMLASGPIMLDTYTFMNVDFGAKAPLVITLDDDESMTLPVELSYFAATLTLRTSLSLPGFPSPKPDFWATEYIAAKMTTRPMPSASPRA
jgi:hypothetical protein